MLNWKVEMVKVAAGNMSAKVRWEETALPSQYLEIFVDIC